MIPTSREVLGVLLLYFFIGLAVYVLDRRNGGVYRLVHNWTHAKDKQLSADTRRGFVWNRGARAKTSVAVVITIVLSVLSFWATETDLVAELILSLFSIPVIVLSFYIGPLVYRLFSRRGVVFDKMDELERGDVSIGDLAKDATQAAGDHIQDAMHLDRDEPDASKATSRPERDEKPGADAAESETSPEERIEKFTKRRKRR